MPAKRHRPASPRRDRDRGHGATPSGSSNGRHGATPSPPSGSNNGEQHAQPAALPAIAPASHRPLPMPLPSGRRMRGSTACQQCRSRKIKCDAQKPRCSACVRRDTECHLDDDPPSLCHSVGPELLQAVTTLTRLLRSQEQARGVATALTTPLVDPLLASATSTSTLTPDTPNPSHPSPSYHSYDVQRHAPASDGRTGRAEPMQGGACGFDAILAWKPLATLVSGLPTSVGVCGRECSFSFSRTECLDMSTLLRLTAKYLTGVHVKNPILDPVILQRYILDTVQHGLDRSPQACLLCLVCAIGAIVGSDETDVPMAPNQTTTASLTSEPEIAFQMFEQASKRLGVAISQDDILAIQCACLTGIWYMCNVQPIKAWRFFSIASTTWCAVSSLCPFSLGRREFSGDEDALAIERNLYFTIFRSESELRMELRLPSSALQGIELSTSFPQPPAASKHHASAQELATNSRAWYYILAETAIRHLLNRLLQFQSITYDVVDHQRLEQMIRDAELFKTQLWDWYRLLPQALKFDEPEELDLDEELDELRFVLRLRLLSCRDLLARPFVQVCVENSLAEIDPGLRQTIVELASGCLRACMQRMSQVRLYTHQGLWFMIRIQAASIAILLAAAQAKTDPELRAAASLIIPHGWRERARNVMAILEPRCAGSEGRGHLDDIMTVLARGLTESL